MLEIGRVVVKIAGRDAGLQGVIIDILDNTYVLLDGEVRRRKCNISHVEPLGKTIDITKNASHAEAMKALGLEEKKKKSTRKKEKTSRPRKLRLKKTYTEQKKDKKIVEKKKKEKGSLQKDKKE